MALDPDSETFIFRKFDRLSARRLLHVQSQIIELEDLLDDLDAEAREGDDECKKGLQRHETFVKRSRDVNSVEGRRMKLLDQIHAKMTEYHEALLLQSKVVNLGRPRKRALDTYKTYFNGRSGREIDKVLFGKARRMLDDDEDIVALRTPSDTDLLSRTLQDHWPERGTTNNSNAQETTLHFLERKVQTLVALINIVVAAVLLIGAITSLYWIKNDKARLGMISMFTTLFALSLGLLTNAKRAEIFAATAAYAAVLVVFVSGGLANG